ncbi:tape measure protein [Teichococcus vastitatis]|uniref:tape measure protein n=1 Tax=Teichococcus vastitatis TaxID=2307076 RepID=UPI000E70956A|nr:tape measure protein [Pseudoroseomonas vastitatis]
MIVRALETLLSFKVDQRGLNEFDRGLNQAVRRAEQVTIGIARMAAGVAAGIASALGVNEIIRAGDEMTSTMNRLQSATGSMDGASRAFESLYSSARETGVALTETSQAFLRFSPAMKTAGYGMADTISLIDGIQKGLLAAGSSAAETSSVFLQLGQAINSGNFAGDELKAFLEAAPPALVNRFAEALGATNAQLREMGSEGKLTTKNVLPALIEAAKAGRDEFGRMQVTVGLATARTRVAMDRLVADLERAFGFTRLLADAIEAVGRKFDEWRRYIPGIRDTVNELGGLERIMGALLWGIPPVTLAILAMNGALTALLVRAALIASPFLAASAAVVFFGAMLQDFYAWVTSANTKTLFGEWFGPFEDLIAPLKGVFQDVKTLFTGAPDEIIAAWDRLKAYFRNWAGEAFANFPPAMRKWLGYEGGQDAKPPQDLPAYGAQAGALTQERITNPLFGKLSDFLGMLGFNRQVQQPDGTMRPLRPGESMLDAMTGSDMIARMRPTNNTTATQNNTFNQNVTVNATGVSGAEVAAGANAGVDRANAGFNSAMEQLSRQFRMALPGAEGAGGMLGAAP